MCTPSRISVVCLGVAILTALGTTTTSAIPPASVPLPRAIEKADFVGIVKVVEVPGAKKEGFRANAPPVVVVKPVAVLKGDAKENLQVVWQTWVMVCLDRDAATVEVVPPRVGDEYMIFLAKGEGSRFGRLGYQWHFHPMPAIPNARLQPSEVNNHAWRGIIEVSPPVAGLDEAVRYRFTRTRLAADPWTGNESNMTAEDIDVVDLTRKQVLTVKKPGVRVSAPAVIEKGQTVVDVIDLTAAFGITKPGEYWVFRGGAFEGNAPLRFEVSDKVRKRSEEPRP